MCQMTDDPGYLRAPNGFFVSVDRGDVIFL